MQWGPAFADLCYRKRVKLVNYPVGLKPIGTPGGLRGAAGVPKEFAKSIVSRWVQYWKQEAKAVNTDSAGDSKSKDADNDSRDEDLEIPVLKDDLVRFEAWKEGKFSGFISISFADVLIDALPIGLKALAEVGIVMQEPQDDEEPIILTKVLHSKVFIKRAAAANIIIDLPEGMEGFESDDEDNSDVETPVVKKSKDRRKDDRHKEDGGVEDNAARGKGSKWRRGEEEEGSDGRGKGSKRPRRSEVDESACEGDQSEAEMKSNKKKSGGKKAVKRKRETESEQVEGSKGSKVKKAKASKEKEKEDTEGKVQGKKSHSRRRAVLSEKKV